MMLKTVTICLMVMFLAGCSRGSRPKEAVATEDLPGVEVLVDGEPVVPFVREGRLLYEKEWIDKSDTSRTPTWRYGLGRLVYDVQNRLVAQTPPADSIKPLLPSFGVNDYEGAGLSLTFAGGIDPADRLIYRYSFHSDRGLVLYDFAGQEPPRAVEFFSLPGLRSEAMERRRRFYIDHELRERLRKAGCVLPKEARAPRWDTEPWKGVPHEEAARDLEQGNWGRIIRGNISRIRSQNRAEKEYRKMLAVHLDSLQREYEKVIERFVADHRAEAYTFAFTPEQLYFMDGVEGRREWVVLPERGFAFELTQGMNLPELPVAVGNELPAWDKARTDLALRHTGRRYWWEFEPVAFIPLWKRYSMDYYTLTIDGVKHPIISSSRRLRPLEAEWVGDKLYFSLLEDDGRARLYVYDRKDGGHTRN